MVSEVPNMMKHLCLAAVLIFLSGLTTSFADGGGAVIRVDHLRWHCAGNGEGGYCNISFELVNTAPTRQIRKVHILGIRRLDDQADENKLPCGQMNFSILLEPGEVVTFQEIMPVVSMPTNITVATGK